MWKPGGSGEGKSMKIQRLATALGVVLAAASVATASSIGVNFTGGGNGSSPAVSLLPTDTAGVVPQANYNNAPTGNGTSVPLVDNAGAPISASLTYTSGGTYSSIGGATIAPAGGDEKLNTGFIFGNASVTVSGIPYARYDLYIYELNDAAGRVETTTLTAPAAGQGPFFGAAAPPADASHVDQNAATPYQYVQAVSTVTASPTPAADYVRFSDLTGSTLTFTISAPGNGYLNGFQIVEVPEPAGLSLIALAAAALLARRR
jgi:hypothetical protein